MYASVPLYLCVCLPDRLYYSKAVSMYINIFVGMYVYLPTFLSVSVFLYACLSMEV